MLGWAFASGCLCSILIIMAMLLLIKSQNPTKRIGTVGRWFTKLELPEKSNDLIYYLDLRSKPKILFSCPPLEKLLGPEKGRQAYKQPDLLFSLLHPEDYESFIRRFTERDSLEKPLACRLRLWEHDEYIWFEDYLSPVYKKGKLTAIQGILRNVHSKKEWEAELHYRLMHDSMTGVHNREFFEEKLAQLNNEEDLSLMLVICDMDNLKQINDSFGHQAGDQYIKSAALMLKQFASEQVLISRIGGDEFALLMIGSTREEGELLIQEIAKTAAATSGIEPGTFLSISIGCAYTECTKEKMHELFLEADRQMYDLKQAKRNEVSKKEETFTSMTGDFSTL